MASDSESSEDARKGIRTHAPKKPVKKHVDRWEGEGGSHGDDVHHEDEPRAGDHHPGRTGQS